MGRLLGNGFLHYYRRRGKFCLAATRRGARKTCFAATPERSATVDRITLGARSAGKGGLVSASDLHISHAFAASLRFFDGRTSLSGRESMAPIVFKYVDRSLATWCQGFLQALVRIFLPACRCSGSLHPGQNVRILGAIRKRVHVACIGYGNTA